MRKYNQKHISWVICTKILGREIGTSFDYYFNAKLCLKEPEKWLVDQRDIQDIKNGNCVIRKVTQEWFS